MEKCNKCKKEGELAYYGFKGHCKECFIAEEPDLLKLVTDAEESVELFKEDLAFASNLKRTADEKAPSFNFGFEISLNTEALRNSIKK